jgi:hypothetical protein
MMLGPPLQSMTDTRPSSRDFSLMFRLTGGIHLITSAWKARGQFSVQGFSSPEGLPDAAGAISVGSRSVRNRSERSVRKKRAVAQDGFEHFGDERFPLLWL